VFYTCLLYRYDPIILITKARFLSEGSGVHWHNIHIVFMSDNKMWEKQDESNNTG